MSLSTLDLDNCIDFYVFWIIDVMLLILNHPWISRPNLDLTKILLNLPTLGEQKQGPHFRKWGSWLSLATRAGLMGTSVLRRLQKSWRKGDIAFYGGVLMLYFVGDFLMALALGQMALMTISRMYWQWGWGHWFHSPRGLSLVSWEGWSSQQRAGVRLANGGESGSSL